MTQTPAHAQSTNSVLMILPAGFIPIQKQRQTMRSNVRPIAIQMR